MCEEKYEKQVSLRTRHCSDSFKEKLGKLPKNEWRKILDLAEEFVISAVDKKLNESVETTSDLSGTPKENGERIKHNSKILTFLFKDLVIGEYEKLRSLSFDTTYHDQSDNDVIFRIKKSSDSPLIHISISTPTMGQGSEIELTELAGELQSINKSYSLSEDNIDSINLILLGIASQFVNF